jgi:cysteine desulfurase/selenocysteine lyase
LSETATTSARRSRQLDIDALRREFPIVNELVYLNSAATGPISLPCQRAMNRQTDERLRFGNLKLKDWEQGAEEVRAKLAQLINVETTGVGFVKNTSDAISIIATGLDWRPGDNIVLAQSDFPSNFHAWLRAREHGVEIRFVADRGGRTCIDDIRPLVDKKTRLVSLSFVRFDTGFRIDLAALGEICRATNTLLMVDVIQGLGALRVDASANGISILVCGSHKWMMGPMGIGFLYINNDALSQVRVNQLGWKNVVDAFGLSSPVEMVPGARRFESGTENWTGILGLGAALKLYNDFGTDVAQTRVLMLNDYLRNGLKRAAYEVLSPGDVNERSGVLICRSTSHDAATVTKRLANENIIVVPRGAGVRIAPHYFNTTAELDQLFAALP